MWPGTCVLILAGLLASTASAEGTPTDTTELGSHTSYVDTIKYSWKGYSSLELTLTEAGYGPRPFSATVVLNATQSGADEFNITSDLDYQNKLPSTVASAWASKGSLFDSPSLVSRLTEAAQQGVARKAFQAQVTENAS